MEKILCIYLPIRVEMWMVSSIFATKCDYFRALDILLTLGLEKMLSPIAKSWVTRWKVLYIFLIKRSWRDSKIAYIKVIKVGWFFLIFFFCLYFFSFCFAFLQFLFYFSFSKFILSFIVVLKTVNKNVIKKRNISCKW